MEEEIQKLKAEINELEKRNSELKLAMDRIHEMNIKLTKSVSTLYDVIDSLHDKILNRVNRV